MSHTDSKTPQTQPDVPPGVTCNSSGCGLSPKVAVLGKTGDLLPLCDVHRPRVPLELLAAWPFEEGLVLPNVNEEVVKIACQAAVLEHIQRCLVLLHPLARVGMTGHEHIPWVERTEEQRVMQEAYSALHGVEKDWLRRLGKPGHPETSPDQGQFI